MPWPTTSDAICPRRFHRTNSRPTRSRGVEDTVVGRLTLDEALARLGDRDSELLALRYDADLKAREIATLLEMDTHAVEVALSRALERLRRLLGED